MCSMRTEGSGVTKNWIHDVLAYWFDEVGPQGWWSSENSPDAEINERFGELWEEQRHRPARAFLGSAESALAAVILFDQFARNLHRDDPRAFATDPLARAIAYGAIGAGYQADYSDDQRQFLYMPFMHSEDLADQQRSLELFGSLGEGSIKFARKHHDIIARFGRFPHRNEVLGRETLPQEKEAVEQGKGW